MSDLDKERGEVIETARRMNALGINVNKSGNVSLRAEFNGIEGFLITPTGIDYEELEKEDIVFIPFESKELPEGLNRRLPSSEWMMHEAVFNERPDLCAIVHTHSAYATALACQELSIPAFHYMVAAAGAAGIDCAPYALFGTKELADIAAKALSHCNACLLSHHGVLAAEKSLKKALKLAHEVENLAHMYVLTRLLGDPKVLSQQQMSDVLIRFQTYGQQREKI